MVAVISYPLAHERSFLLSSAVLLCQHTHSNACDDIDRVHSLQKSLHPLVTLILPPLSIPSFSEMLWSIYQSPLFPTVVPPFV